MNHRRVIVNVRLLSERIRVESDGFDIVDALGLEIARPRRINSDDDTAWDTAWDTYDAHITAWVDDHAYRYVVVSWPEHVLTPKYNSDADYIGPMSFEEATVYAFDAVPHAED